MPFDSTLIVGEKTFALQSWNAAGAVRINTSSTLAEPDLLSISHETIKATSNKAARDAHLIKQQVTLLDGNEQPQIGAVYLRFDIPRNSDFTASVVRKMLCAVLGVVLADDFAITGETAANQEGLDSLPLIMLGLS